MTETDQVPAKKIKLKIKKLKSFMLWLHNKLINEVIHVDQ